MGLSPGRRTQEQTTGKGGPTIVEGVTMTTGNEYNDSRGSDIRGAPVPEHFVRKTCVKNWAYKVCHSGLSGRGTPTDF